MKSFQDVILLNRSKIIGYNILNNNNYLTKKLF